MLIFKDWPTKITVGILCINRAYMLGKKKAIVFALCRTLYPLFYKQTFNTVCSLANISQYF